MELIHRVAITLVLVSLVAGCVGPCAEDPPPPVEPAEPVTVPADVRAAEPEEPVEELERDVLALARDLESDDPAVVLAAAVRLEWYELTSAEMERLVPLLWKAYLADLDGDVNWNDLRSFVGSSDVPDILRSLPDEMKPDAAEFIAGGLHRMMLAEHLPVLAEKLDQIDDRAYRGALLGDLLWIPLEYTDRHRERAARVLLENHASPGAPQWEESPSAGPGFPSLLADLLERWTVGSDANPCPDHWLARWIRDETPGPRDASTLLRLAETKWQKVRDAAIRALGFLSDEETLRWLDANRGMAMATGALARRGDQAALDDLRDASDTLSTELAVFLDVAPTAAVVALRERILGPDEAVALRTLDLIAELTPPGDYWQDVAWDEGWFAGVPDEALRRKLSGERLALIGAHVPGCRDRRLAEAATRHLAENLPPASFLEDVTVGAFLELGALDDYLRVLREAAVSPDGETRDAACPLLMRLGDHASAEILVEYARETGVDEWNNVFLAEIGGEVIEEYLLEVEDDAALAVFHGLPRSAGWLSIEDAPDPEPIRRLIRSGKPVEALLAAFEQDPSAGCFDPGRVKDERIREYLQQRRARRLDVPWATQQLMLMGDEKARAEVRAALFAGRYRYVDRADTHILTLDHDLTTIPHWIDDLESNCCRVNVVAVIFDDIFGLDLDDVRSSPCVTMAEVARRFWERHGDALVESRIAGHLVPAVR